MTLVEINYFLISLIFSFNQNGFVNGIKNLVEKRSLDDSGSEIVTETVIQITSFTSTKQEDTLGKLIVRIGVPFGLTLRDMNLLDFDLLAIFSTFQDADHLLVQDYGFFYRSTSKDQLVPLKIKVTNLAPLLPSIDHIVVADQDDEWGYQVYSQSLERLKQRLKEFKNSEKPSY